MIRRKANNREFLDIFGLPQMSQEILVNIITHGDSSVAEISARLGIPKSSIYDAVTPLVEQSLVNEYVTDRCKKFGISDNDQLIRAHMDRMEQLKNAQSSLLSFIQQNHSQDTFSQPKIKFYAGTLGIKQAFRDMPWQKNIRETYTLWPAKLMIDIDEAFFKWHGAQRFKYKVFINAVQNHSDRAIQKNKNHEWLKNDAKNNLTSVRYLPKGEEAHMSFWIHGDKCLFASGGKEKIAFTIHSKEFCQIMKIMWDRLWEKAKK